VYIYQFIYFCDIVDGIYSSMRRVFFFRLRATRKYLYILSVLMLKLYKYVFIKKIVLSSKKVIQEVSFERILMKHG